MTRPVFIAALAALAFTVSAQGAQTVKVTLSEWKLQFPGDTLRAGLVTFEVKNTGTVTHGFHVSGNGIDKGTRDIAKGESATLSLTLKAGTYEVYCPMSDMSHKAAGMTGKLIVREADTAPGR